MTNKLRTGGALALGWFIFLLSHCMPRDPRLWVFSGWYKNNEREIFADNSKYLFLYVHNQAREIRAVWIGKDEKICSLLRKAGFEAHTLHSVRGVYLSLRAGVTVADAFLGLTNWQWSGGSAFIQLWHGKGPKKIGYNSPYGFANYNRFFYPYLFRKPVFQIATSPFTASLVASSFGLPIEKIRVTGLPKYDVFSSPQPGSQIDVHLDLQKKIESAKNRDQKVALYAPTFRPDGSNPIQKLDLGALDESLEGLGIRLIISLHPKFSAQDWMPKNRFRHLDFIAAGYDLYPLFSAIDILVTDYSSTYVDFLYINKPIIFFPFDIDSYRAKMGLHDEFWDLMPGPEVRTIAELVDALRNEDRYAKERSRVRSILFTHTDAEACKRVTEEIRQL